MKWLRFLQNYLAVLSIIPIVAAVLLVADLPALDVSAQAPDLSAVVYPPEADTDYEKLCAVYSLIEQMRLEHNRVTNIARSNPRKYIESGIFKTYALLSKAQLKKLLAERNTLMEKIRWANYNPDQWGKLTEKELQAAQHELFGDKESLKHSPTEARAPPLDELKAIDINKLEATPTTDPTEDFTSASWNNGTPQSDPGGFLTVTSTKVAFDALDRNNDTYFYRDMGANHFDGDYEHLLQTLKSGYVDAGLAYVWVLANEVDDWFGLLVGDKDALGLWWYYNSRLYIRELDGGAEYSDYASLSQGTLYYVELERDEAVGTYGTIYAYICTGDYWDDGGTQIDTISVALNTSKKDFRYIYSINSLNDGDNTKTITGYMQNLDLQEAGVSAPTVVTNAASSVEETTATLSGNITATGGENCTRWFEWDTLSGAPYSDNWSDAGTHGVGNYTHGITGLDKGEGYYYRASANNSAGWGYGSEVFLITKPDPATSFIATDNGTTWISTSWSNGDGMDYVEIRYSDVTYPTDNTSGSLGYWGSGTTANVTGLSPSTTYFFSIFTHATENSQWSTADTYDTCWDTTDAGITAPTVTTGAATLVEETTARLNGEITDTGGENCTRGFQWDTDLASPYADNWTDSGTHGTGAFNHDLTGLNKGDKYAFRATANNTAGYGYGSVLYYMTKPDPATGFTATDEGTSWISLGWTNGTGMDYVEVRYAEGGSSPSDNTSGTLGYWGVGTTANVTGLNPGTQHSFRIFTHAYEDATWSLADNNPTCQDTTDVDAPTVTNGVGATNVTDNDARLNGEITYTGGENPAVTVFWGQSDGDTNPVSWTDNASLGAKALGTFYHDITDNLTPETLYYYRMRAVNSEGTDWAGSSANFTTTEVGINAPTGLTLTDLGAITVNIEWAMGDSSNYTMVRVSRTEYPATITDGELVYYGDATTVNATGYSLDVNNYKFTAWAFAADNVTYSEDYAQAEIGGEGMEEIAEGLAALVEALQDNDLFNQAVILFLALVITALAFWQKNVFLYCLAVPVNMVLGLGLAADAETVYSIQWVLGVIVAIIGMFCLYRAAMDAWDEIKRRREGE